jgi:hypothetical protein
MTPASHFYYKCATQSYILHTYCIEKAISNAKQDPSFSFLVLLSFLFVLSISVWQNTARGQEVGTAISHWPIHGCESHASAQMGPIKSRCHTNEKTNRRKKRETEFVSVCVCVYACVRARACVRVAGGVSIYLIPILVGQRRGKHASQGPTGLGLLGGEELEEEGKE